MWYGFSRFRARGAGLFRILLIPAIGLGAVACNPIPATLLLSSAEIRDQTPFVPVSVSQSWINAPHMVLVLQRGLRGEAEQRVALQNRSGVPGENVIIMRAQSLPGSAGRFVYEDFIRWAGGAPAPFVGLRSGDLVTNEDGLGPFFWAERRIGDDTVCVLGVRRVHAAQRLLPGEATVMDILLRNCVRGTAQDAIRPLLEGSVSTQPLPGVSAGETRVLSPLAAPDLR